LVTGLMSNTFFMKCPGMDSRNGKIGNYAFLSLLILFSLLQIHVSSYGMETVGMALNPSSY